MKFVIFCGIFVLLALAESASIVNFEVEPEADLASAEIEDSDDSSDATQELTRQKRNGFGFGGYPSYGYGGGYGSYGSYGAYPYGGGFGGYPYGGGFGGGYGYGSYGGGYAGNYGYGHRPHHHHHHGLGGFGLGGLFG